MQGLAHDKVGQNGVYPPWGVVFYRDVSDVTRSQSAWGVLEEVRSTRSTQSTQRTQSTPSKKNNEKK